MELTRFLMLAAGVRAATTPLSLPALTPLAPLPSALTPLVDGAAKTPASFSQTGAAQPAEIAGNAQTRTQLVEPSTSDTKLYIGTSGTHWFIVSGSNPLATQTANNATATAVPKETPAPDFTGAPQVLARVFEVGGVTVSDNSESKLVVGSQTLEPGSSIVVGTGVSTTPIALHTEEGTTRIVVGTTTAVVPTPTPVQPEKPAADHATTAPVTSPRPSVVTIPAGTIAYNSRTQIIVNGHTLSPSSTLTLGTGTKTTAYHLVIKPTVTYLAVASEGSSGASTAMLDLWGSKGVPTGLDHASESAGGWPTTKPTAATHPSATATTDNERTTTSPAAATTMQTTTRAADAASSASANGGASVLTADSVPTTGLGGHVSWPAEETPAASAPAATYTGAAAPRARIDYSQIGVLGFLGVPLALLI
ncbi:Phytanoyl-CoA dioxygenase [Macrophomina phaseolina MS6]|uniref:Phytanoyl-CoA dioxygenase n=1 Tax=Macrophomina phaseolina (strain MS6) TaxID=1126212 RepID=K2RNZ7_MACPH|nr:Phytanoyl-CoA dioxygenase [Macrophomina phaseolina MS6]